MYLERDATGEPRLILERIPCALCSGTGRYPQRVPCPNTGATVRDLPGRCCAICGTRNKHLHEYIHAPAERQGPHDDCDGTGQYRERGRDWVGSALTAAVPIVLDPPTTLRLDGRRPWRLIQNTLDSGRRDADPAVFIEQVRRHGVMTRVDDIRRADGTLGTLIVQTDTLIYCVYATTDRPADCDGLVIFPGLPWPELAAIVEP